MNKIIGDYDDNVKLYREFAQKMHSLVRDLLKNNNINYHAVTFRTKDRSSFVKKISKPDKRYEHLADITDIVGVRIITYFEDEIHKVSKIIEKEFEIDKPNSMDKKLLLDPDRFGYLSLHHVVTLLPERSNLTEYSRFPGLKVEIQTRSILQHAWAEIEHDLGYKSKQGVPDEVRRDFSRLAGLLELADKQFISIKKNLSEYEKIVPQQIHEAPSLVKINDASLNVFLAENNLVKVICDKIAESSQIKINDSVHIGDLTERLKLCGLENIAQIETNLNTYLDTIVLFAKDWLGSEGTTDKSISVFYLCYVLLAAMCTDNEIDKFVKGILPSRNSEQFANTLRTTYSRVTSKV